MYSLEKFQKHSYIMPSGQEVKYNLYIKSSGRASLRYAYGEIFIFVNPRYPSKVIPYLLEKSLETKKGYMTDRPFYRKDDYIYVLGRRRTLTADIRMKENPSFYYYRGENPLPSFRKKAQIYFKERVLHVSRRMGIDASLFKIETGIFFSFYAECSPSRKVLKFDYRLYSYSPEIVDFIVTHELSHLLERKHSKRFYRILGLYCPDHKELCKLLDRGIFEGYSYGKNN